jgi:hypothetical protein
MVAEKVALIALPVLVVEEVVLIHVEEEMISMNQMNQTLMKAQ